MNLIKNIIKVQEINLEIIFQFSDNERLQLQDSIIFLKKNIDFFIIRFYHHLLQTEAGSLFRNSNMENQYKMFNVSLKIILSYIEDPEKIKDYLGSMAQRHAQYGVNTEHTGLFIDSFMNAWKELFDNNYEENLFNLWYKIISEILFYFKDNLH